MIAGVLLDDGHHLLAEALENLLLVLIELILGVLNFALQALLAGLDVFIEVSLGGLAQGVLALVELILQAVNSGLLVLYVFLLGRGFGVQLRGGFLALFGADDGLLNRDDGDLAGLGGRLRKGGSSHG